MKHKENIEWNKDVSWSHIIELHRQSFQRDFVACHEPAERQWLVEKMLGAFPQWRKNMVETAIKKVCNDMRQTPRARHAFFRHLQVTLENSDLVLPHSSKPASNKSQSTHL